MLQKHAPPALSSNLMRGLRLFVRPIDAADHPAVAEFLARQDPRTTLPPLFGLLGKLLGDIVAVAAVELTADALRLDDIIVARDLRKKRIGRVMIRELEELAAKMDRR